MVDELIIRTTKERGILDITQQVQELLAENSFREGICHLFLLHTSAAITTADLDEGTDLDMLDAFELVVPALKYRHKHNPEHVKYHILASLIGPSLAVPVENGELVLGAWQKIILIEFGGPRERNIVVSFS